MLNKLYALNLSKLIYYLFVKISLLQSVHSTVYSSCANKKLYW